MNCSDNLISLSDSGVGSSLSTSTSVSVPAVSQCSENIVDDAFAIFENAELGGNTGILDITPPRTSGGGTNPGSGQGGGTDLLIDLSDEVQVPLHQGILRQAEIDDTFGIFSMAQQSSQGSVGGSNDNQDKLIADDDEEDEAAKLVRSFTSGRKSDGAGEKKKKSEPVKSEQGDANKLNESDESVASDQPTIVDSEGPSSPKLPDNEDGEKIVDEKMDLTSSTNMSGGSDSEILDIGNLSSFSIPEEEMDDNKFIEDIKREDMAGSSITRAVVNQIKLDILKGDDDDEEEEEKENDDNWITGRSRSDSISSRLRDLPYGLISDTTRPSLVSNSTRSTFSNRLSSSSTTSSGTSRWSTSSQQKNSTVLGDPSGTSNNGGCVSNTRSRLSSGNFGSPIRASYPVSNRYFMPTPKNKTPAAVIYTPGNRDTYRDRLSESLLSPSRTRVMLITGDSHRSPSRAPVRKSISAETLHYEYSSCARDEQRHVVKFSTPSASKKTRSSFSTQSGMPEYPNFFGDDRPQSNHDAYQISQVVNTGRPEFTQYRGRLSYASSASNSSLHTLSPSSSKYSKEVCTISSQLNRINLDDSHNAGINTSVQPVRVTAVVAPTNISKPNIKPSALSTNTAKVGFHLPSKPKTTGQQGHNRPIAASSPLPTSTSVRPGANHTTPTRSKYGGSVRSSGYGGQQNLNSTFGANQALKSPNKVASTSANIKPAAIPKSLKTGVPSLGNKIELGTRGGGSTTTRIGGITALKPGCKLPAPSSSGLRRPGTTSTVSTGNKENKPRSGTTTATSRIGLMQRYHQ